ncbi:MAG: DNA alkylation repair protein [Saprospiraceae bacterium]|nr:DNA alkylation repair protein [Saprospiraceae bacterium]
MNASNRKRFEYLETELLQVASPERASQMKAYMRDQFDYLGINSPQRKEISRFANTQFPFQKMSDFAEWMSTCWKQPYREYKYICFDLGFRLTKKMDVNWVEFFEPYIVKDSWWDTVDGITPHFLGDLLKSKPKMLRTKCEQWIESDNIWYQRSAHIVQLRYARDTDFPLMCEMILRRADSKEFFVKKAAGWALRQYSKYEPDKVKKFIEKNTLSGLTVREGMKHITKTTT